MKLITISLFISFVAVGFNTYNVVNNRIKTEKQLLLHERDSLLSLTQSQQIVIDAYREHLGECSFISRHQVRRVTNELWIELHNPYSLLIAHRELSEENIEDMIKHREP